MTGMAVFLLVRSIVRRSDRLVSAGRNSSQRRHAAIHEQQGAGDVGGIVGGQEQDRGGDLLGPARALPAWCPCAALALYCSTVWPAAAMRRACWNRREDRARADGVHADALAASGRRQAPASSPRPRPWWCRIAGCRRRRRRNAREAVLTMAPPPVRRISGTARLGAEDVAHQVDAEDLVPSSPRSPRRPSRICGCRHC